ncbi:LuxR C-terminal-related transcriptional regulator [Streptomyces caeni]|uniref:LuxR C-terminal-related transcriptional regulator n=1 Tax=Streptomyces caeni TaxID=2307231 RepID=A0ABW4IW14_9ACTN
MARPSPSLHDHIPERPVPEPTAQVPPLPHVQAPGLTVALYGGDPLTRAGVTAQLAQHHDIEVIPRAEDSPDFTKDVAIVLVDQLDVETGVQLRKLAAGYKRRVVLVVGELADHQLTLVLEAGISSVVWRHQANSDGLVKAARVTARNEGDMPGDLLRRLLAKLERRDRGTVMSTVQHDPPTRRELDVLELVSQGLGTKEIADQLSYSERTIKGILRDVMMRLNVRNRAHAVAHAIREGYI